MFSIANPIEDIFSIAFPIQLTTTNQNSDHQGIYVKL